MLFKLAKRNTAPLGSTFKIHHVCIQVCDPVKEDDKFLIGSWCQTPQEFNEQIEECIRSLRRLQKTKIRIGRSSSH